MSHYGHDVWFFHMIIKGYLYSHLDHALDKIPTYTPGSRNVKIIIGRNTSYYVNH